MGVLTAPALGKEQLTDEELDQVGGRWTDPELTRDCEFPSGGF